MSKKFILHLGPDQKLSRLLDTPYDSEDQFQDLLMRHPELIAGDLIDRNEARRWLPLEREMGIRDSEGASERWWIDHVFVDQDGVLTLVEVKRKTDTRLRREVVGQMLDYAAHAMKHWTVDDFRRPLAAGNDEAELLLDKLGVDDPDAFWEMVDVNRRAGRIRLLFVADRIPRELERVIEFLNEMMNPTEVLGVEIRRYRAEGASVECHVPSVVGHTMDAERNKSTASKRYRWTRDEFMAEFLANNGTEHEAALKGLLEFIDQHALKVNWGSGKSPSCSPYLAGGSASPITVNANGDLWLKLEWEIGGRPVREWLANERLPWVDRSQKYQTVPMAEWSKHARPLLTELTSLHRQISDSPDGQ